MKSRMRVSRSFNSSTALPIWTIVPTVLLILLLFSFQILRAEENFICRVSSSPWDPDSGLGNHRALVRVKQKADAVFVHIPWRRPDRDPKKKKVLVVEARTNEIINNVFPAAVTQDCGDFIFQALRGPGDYYFYYLPYKLEGSKNYPKAMYLEPEYQADAAWLQRNGLRKGQASVLNPAVFPRAEVIVFETVDEFSSFYPMEVVASAEETQKIIDRNQNEPFLIFPEDRQNPIRMSENLPLRWVEKGPQLSFEGQAARGEYYIFQLGLFAFREKLENIKVRFSDLEKSGSTERISADEATCFNTGGTGWDGQPFEKELNVEKGKIQPLWCGWQMPKDILPGDYEGCAEVSARNTAARKIAVKISVTDKLLAEAGDSELWRLSRLRWLNSLLAVDDEVVQPFTPLEVKGRTIKCLGRSLTLSESGLPEKIQSFFTPEMTRFQKTAVELLAEPVQLSARDFIGLEQKWKSRAFAFTRKAAGTVCWEAASEIPSLNLTVEVNGRMEFDGYVEFKVRIKAEVDSEVDDIRLVIPVRAEVARYMMGLGFKGSFRPPSFSWTWDQQKNQDALWLGTVNAGVQVQLKAENYSRPLNTNFYKLKPLNLPPPWWNEGKGWVSVKEEIKKEKKYVVLTAASGSRQIKKGEVLCFDFNLLLTPFKLICPGKHFSERYYHAFKPAEEIANAGANIINVHHATEINPYINYPFLRLEKMKAYTDDAHSRGMKVKIYYTIRELSNRAAELFALKSLGSEIFTDGPGGGYSWLQEHLRPGYIAGWFVPELKDAAVINSGMSRWHNYYIEGLAWLCQHAGIDGLYIDDVAFDRVTMKRVRKVLERNRPGSLIDLHSANQYNPRDGFASSANLYMEHFPYIDRLWFGEYFDYNSKPDYWLVEISGIPFGLMGEMLEKGGNPWRGMLYGMTSRLPWSGDPRPLWKVWDEFGIKEAQMLGYWSPNCPAKTDKAEVLATVYLKKGSALVALASWSDKVENCQLLIDWKKLGLDPKSVLIEAPAIENFQPARGFRLSEAIPVDPGKGWLLLIKRKN